MNVPMYFLGNRDYVNGLTIVEESTRIFQPRYVHSVYFHKFLRGHATVTVDRLKKRDRSGCCTIAMGTQRGDVSIVVNESPTLGSIPRIPDYNRGRYVDLYEQGSPDGSVRAKLVEILSSRDLLRAIVEVMQQVTDEELPSHNLSGKSYWAWMRDYPVLSPTSFTGTCTVTLTPSRTVTAKDKMFFVRHASIEGFSQPIEFGYFAGVANE